jgi:hypothetical protein
MSRLTPSALLLPTALLSAVLATGAIGCGQASSGVPVDGHVSYHGQPIAHGALMFFPARGRAITTATDAAGHYALELAPGEYAVTVNLSVKLPAGWKEGDPIPPPEIDLPTEYTMRIKTPLKATVAAGGEQVNDFVIP